MASTLLRRQLVASGQESEDRGQKIGRVEGVGLVVLAQHTPAVDAVGQDVGFDLLGGRGPGRLLVGVAPDRGQFRGAIERHPAHELGGHVVLGFAARFPDALVGFAPYRGGARRLRLDERPQPAREALTASRVEQDRVEHRAVHVVLALVQRPVADAHRAGAGVAGQVISSRLGQVAPPVDPVHDLQSAILDRLELHGELHELVRLPVQIQVVQRLEGEGRVAHPRVAVVPVALAAGRLGQRRGQRGHRRSGRHVRQAFDGERRPLQRRPVRVIDGARPPQPGPPETRRWRPGSHWLRRCHPVRPGPRPRTARSRPARPARGRAGRAPGLLRCPTPCRSAA